MENITEIRFPNTVSEVDQHCFRISFNCDEIITIQKNGDMAGVNWFQVIKNNKIIAEIKESVCNIFGNDDLKEV